MTTYRVKWEVDVEADNPRQAARRAWAIQRGRTEANRTRDGRATAVFDVYAPGQMCVTVDFRNEPVARRRMVRDLPKTITRYGVDKATGLVLAPRPLDQIATELIQQCKGRNMSPALRTAIEGLVGRPTIAEAMYPELAVRAARVLLEVIAVEKWRSDGTRIRRIRAELLDQIEDYERFRAELNRGETT
jgi:hypothetical protein